MSSIRDDQAGPLAHPSYPIPSELHVASHAMSDNVLNQNEVSNDHGTTQANPEVMPHFNAQDDADMDLLLSGLGSDDLDDFGDIDGADIEGDRSYDSALSIGFNDAPPVFPGGDVIPKMIGFATGHGRKLPPPSKAALDSVKKLWAEEEDKNAMKGQDRQSDEYGFDDDFGELGSDTIDSQASRAKKPRLSDSTEDIPVTVGFKTGRGAIVPPPSRSALDKAAKLFQDLDQQHMDTPVPLEPEGGTSTLSASSFTFASGKPAPPPKSASMADVKHLFDDDDSEAPVIPALSSQPPSQPPSSSGFQLGSGKKAPPPSSASMAKVKSLFDDIDNPPSSPSLFRSVPPPSGFATASGKAAAPLNNASVAKAMHLFDDIDTNQATPIRPRPQPPVRPTSPATTTPLPMRNRTGFVPPSTPLRTPLATTTNTFSTTKKSISIKTPAGGTRRIGLGGGTLAQKSVKRGFTTPFKTVPSFRVQDPGPSQQRPVVHYQPVFDLTRSDDRENYKDAHLHPQYFSRRELDEMGIPNEIWAIGLNNASLYRFLNSDKVPLGHEEALSVLQHDGCSFATSKWVENHWSQILWKLAGEILAKPDLFPSKWTWNEVISQLKYRYEREYGNTQRSIIKRIQEHDSSPSLPMVLFVSAIKFGQGEDKKQICLLELSDGWYRIQAQVDECLHRAVTKGKIVLGRKIAISGAKLESGSDGAEVLDAFNTSHLIITGNSTSLSRWYTRLGIQSRPFIASLGSLSVDGGLVTLMDVVLEKVFPVAHMNGGKNAREAPWGEKEEQIRQDAWTERHDAERSRLEDKMRRQMEKMEDIASTLAQSAEETDPVSSEPPDSLESDFDALLEAKDVNSRLRGMSAYHIVHLARYANSRMRDEMSEYQTEIEAELSTICPKRDVRDFRMVRFVDAGYGVREPFRVGMLNVWDVKLLGENLEEGKRYLISNLMPGRSGDWSLRRDRADKAEIYLHTRRDTRWQPVS